MTREQPYVVDEGSGPPVLLLHGLAASTRIWGDVVAAGADRHRFISVDLPRSGRSRAWCASNPEAIADGLSRLLDEKGIARCLVAGHSFGGLAAIELAARWPKRVSGLVLASSPALGLTPQLKLFVEARATGLLMPLISRLPMPRRAVSAYFQLLWGDRSKLTPRHVDIYMEALSAFEVWPGMLEAAQAIAGYRLPIDVLRSSGVPMSVLWGDRDRLVPIAQGEQLARALSVELQVLRGAGHCLPEERPDALLAAIDGAQKRAAGDRSR